MWLSLSVPCDVRYLEAVHDLVARVAEQAGYARPVASGIAISIHAAAQGVIERTAAWDGSRAVSLDFATGAAGFEITMRFNGCTGMPRPALESSMRQVSPGAMDHVEIVNDGGAWVCRLLKALPPRG